MSLQSSDAQETKSPKQDTPEKKHTEVVFSEFRGPHFATDTQGLPTQGFAGRGREYDRTRRLVPRVKMALRILLDATFWVPADIKADEDNDYNKNPEFEDRDKFLVPWLRQQIKRMKHDYSPFRDSMRSFTTMAMTTGIAVAEKVYESINGQWIIVGIKVKPSWDFQPWVDEWGNLVGLWHYPSGKLLNPDRFLFAVWPFLHGENYLGEPEIEAIQHDIDVLNANRAAMTRYIHKASISPLELMYGNHLPPEQQQKILSMVKDLDSMSVVTVPATQTDEGLQPDFEIKPQADRSSQPLLTQMAGQIDYDNKEISRTIGVPDLLGVTDTAAGSWALGRTQFDAFTARPENTQVWLEHHVTTQILHDAIRYNFRQWYDDYEYLMPRYSFELLDEDFQAKVSQRVINEKNAGLQTTEEARAQLGYSRVPDEAV